MGHLDQFKVIEKMWLDFKSTGALSPENEAALQVIEARDSIFAEIDPSLWARDSHKDSHLPAS
jgi:hypothetical protein